MGKSTFNNIAYEWLQVKKSFVKQSTLSAYTLIIENHLLPEFSNKTSINEYDVQKFTLLKHNNGLSNKSLKDILTVLKMIVKFGIKHNFESAINWEIIIPKEAKKETLEVFNIETQRKIMNYVMDNFTFKNLGIYLCLSSGLRIGEICALQWKDINIITGSISITKTIGRIYKSNNTSYPKTELIIDTPKTKNSIREIPITMELIRILKPIIKVVNPDYYVLTNDSQPLEPRTYRNYYKRLMSSLNIPKLKFHGLRHSFATRCIESNCDYKTVSVLLGHSNISTTLNLYVHPNFDQKRKCIIKMFRSLK